MLPRKNCLTVSISSSIPKHSKCKKCNIGQFYHSKLEKQLSFLKIWTENDSNRTNSGDLIFKQCQDQAFPFYLNGIIKLSVTELIESRTTVTT